ncbi:MOSC domain-containing protein [Tabrizicola sp.]|uniref:MOSC domain-containing protein n=1 Tax=Tabrizicola sp. TaxID=2005166 RepID=UPI00286B083E|nr:hypothetical protein [Tabrizicola sp.]
MTQTATDSIDAAALAAALPEVLAAPRTNGPVRLLCARPKPNQRNFPDRLTLTRAICVVGDFEASRPWLVLEDGSPDPRNQVSIMSSRVLDLVWRDRNPRNHPGDNIAVDLDLSHGNLPTGTLLQVGTAVLRVSDEPNDGCVKWKVRCGRAAYDWVRARDHAGYRLRGLYCSVEQDGIVELGDRVARI